MKAMLGMIVSAGLLAAATPAVVAQPGPHVLVPGPVVARELHYGPAPRQVAQLFVREKAGRAPLIVYLHGGGWSAGTPRAGSAGAQPDHFTGAGYAYATIGYRFVPEATVEQQLADIAQGIVLLRQQKGVDRNRIVLLGHSSGGHLAALLGADPVWLEKAGVPFETVKAVVLLDPAAIDIPPIIAAGRGAGTVARYYQPAFGDDPARQAALSPLSHAEAPNAPAWLMLHDVNNPLAGLQSQQLSVALIAAGAREATVLPVQDTTHLRLNDEIGRAGNNATVEIDAFLARIFPETRRARMR
jgi:acetyl esterase/lipase